MIALAALTLSLACSARAASTDAVQANPFAAMKEIDLKLEAEIDARLAKGDYLGAVSDSEAFIKDAPDPATLSFLLDIHSSFLAFAGKDGQARLSMASSQRIGDRTPFLLGDYAATQAARDQVKFEEPEAVLTEAAKTHQLIMFSEAHHIAEHRAFGARMLPLLRKLGFSVLAMEALKFPVPDKTRRVGRAPGEGVVDGYYLREPRMAGLVREAQRLGFTLVAYEDETTDGKLDREEVQARNLVERVFAKNPKAKVVVWAGYGHIYKAHDEWKEMAQRVWEKTGIEPFSLFQESDSLDPHMTESPLYKSLILDNPHPPDHPVVVRARKGLYPALDALGVIERTKAGTAFVDGFILHPPFRESAPGSLRPAWLPRPGLFKLGGRENAGAFIQAFPKNEGTSATPADQMAPDFMGRYELWLPKGEYILRALGKDAAVLSEETVRVPRSEP